MSGCDRVRMKVPFNDLSRSARAQARDLTGLVAAVVDRGWFIHGPHHAGFETQLASYLDVSHVVGVASGTDALELALRSVRSPNRNVVVTVANAGGYTTCAAIAAGYEVRFCDIDATTHTMDPARLDDVLDESVVAVVVTHLYGRLGDVAAIRRRCEPLGVRVIEDCAQALGARTAVAMGGALGDLATFSFYPTKNLGALGDGGAIATSDAALFQTLKALRQYGWTEKYRNTIRGGRNSRLDELQAAILSYRLPRLDDDNRRRREIIGRYVSAAPDGVRVLPAEGPHHVGHLAVVETDDAADLRSHFSTEGVATDVHYPTPDHRQPMMAATAVSLPVTDSKVGRILSVPCFPELTDAEVDTVVAALSVYRKDQTG